MAHPRSAEFPGFTSAQIEAGLTTPVCDGVPRYPHADEFADTEAAWGEPEFVALNPASEPFAFDSLAVAAPEYVAAQAKVERFWLSLLGAIGVFITAFGLCAWAAFGGTLSDDVMKSLAASYACGYYDGFRSSASISNQAKSDPIANCVQFREHAVKLNGPGFLGPLPEKKAR